MLVPLDRPAEGQPHWTVSGELREGLQENGIGEVPRLQALVMAQARQPFDSGFLLAKAAGQLRLAAGLLINNGPHEIPDGFALMAMGPGQHMHDIIIETSGRRVLRSRTPRLA